MRIPSFLARWRLGAFALVVGAAYAVACTSFDAPREAPTSDAGGDGQASAPSDAGSDAPAEPPGEEAGAACDYGSDYPGHWTLRAAAPNRVNEDTNTPQFTVEASTAGGAAELVTGIAGAIGSITCTLHVHSTTSGPFDFIELVGGGDGGAGEVHLGGGVSAGGALAVHDDHYAAICDGGVCPIASGTGDPLSLSDGATLTFHIEDGGLELRSGDAGASVRLLGGPRSLPAPELRVGVVARGPGSFEADIDSVCCHTTP